MSILKANHNDDAGRHFAQVVSNIVNVHFESKPQLLRLLRCLGFCCVKYR